MFMVLKHLKKAIVKIIFEIYWKHKYFFYVLTEKGLRVNTRDSPNPLFFVKDSAKSLQIPASWIP